MYSSLLLVSREEEELLDDLVDSEDSEDSEVVSSLLLSLERLEELLSLEVMDELSLLKDSEDWLVAACSPHPARKRGRSRAKPNNFLSMSPLFYARELRNKKGHQGL